MERERRRHDLHEPYRTLLGHFRHEVGHYYWDRLIKDSALGSTGSGSNSATSGKIMLRPSSNITSRVRPPTGSSGL